MTTPPDSGISNHKKTKLIIRISCNSYYFINAEI